MDGGVTWSSGSIISNKTFETGPTPSLIASKSFWPTRSLTLLQDGRVYRAMEYFPPPHVWGVDYQAVILSASVDDDLMDPESWTFTTPVPFNLSWLPSGWPKLEAPGYLEGNAVLGRDGNIYNILRFNSRPVPGNKAIVLKMTNLHTLE